MENVGTFIHFYNYGTISRSLVLDSVNIVESRIKMVNKGLHAKKNQISYILKTFYGKMKS